MKTITLIITILTTTTISAEATFKDDLKAYTLPCSMVIAAGALTAAGLPFGLVSCAASIMFSSSSNNKRELAAISEKIDKVDESVKGKLDAESERSTEELLSFRDSIRRVVSSKIVESDVRLESKALEFMKSEAFEKEVRNRVNKIIKSETLLMAKGITLSIDKQMIDKISAKVISEIIEKKGQDNESK